MFIDAWTTFLEFLRISVSLSFLLISSWYDFKTREVTNRLWLFFAPVGSVLTVLQFSLDYLEGAKQDPVLWLISFSVTTGISLGLFYVGFFGGADAKALICISLALPVHPTLINHRPNVLSSLFPLTVLSNSVMMSSLLVLAITSYNLLYLVQRRGRMFEGLETESLGSKILAFITGFKVGSDKIKDGCHYIPLEDVSRGKDGEIVRHLRISVRLKEETPHENDGSVDIYKRVPGKIWATPGLPFLIFVTAGFVAALLFGDFVTWIIIRLIGPAAV